jgi:hypothetical protein
MKKIGESLLFKLINGKLFDKEGIEFLPNQTFRTVEDALAWLLIIGMSGVMVYE